MNLARIGHEIDRAIGVIAPRRGLARMRSRLVMDLTQEFARRHTERFRYDGADAGRRAHGWFAGSADANVELMGSLIWLRNRARELARNNPHASKGLEELVGNCVGTGITPQSATGDEQLDALINDEWKFFVDECDIPQRMDFYGMQSLVMRTTVESGEGLVRFRPRLMGRTRIPLQLQLLESDFLDQSRTMGTVNGHVMQGVEFNLDGERVAYWLFSYHPGGVLMLNPRGGIVSQAVPAEEILHVYRVLRPGQVRGVPWMAPVMIPMRDLDDFCDAERVRKKIEACVVAFVEQTEGIDGTPLGLPSKDTVTGDRAETFEPGMIEYLKPGQKASFNNPPPAGGYGEYKRVELQAIAAGLGIPNELLTGDMSQVTYSSWRGGMLGFRNTIENYRWLTLLPQFAMPVRRRFIDTLVLMGKIPARTVNDPKIALHATLWTAPKFESVDPLKDALGELKRIRTGTLTLSEAIAMNGYDPATQLREIARMNALLDALGIVLDCDPRRVNDKGVTQSDEPLAKAEKASADELAIAADPVQFRKRLDLVQGHAQDLGMRSMRSQLRSWENPTRLMAA